MDQHVSNAITKALRSRNVNVLTAYEDGTSEWDDYALLDRASALGRVLFSRDADFLAETTQRQRTNRSFSGVVYARQLHVPIGTCISDLEIIALTGEPHDSHNRLIYLPL